jgi:GTP-binding protein
VTDLLEGIFKVLPASSLGEERTEGEIRVALVGRPNVGKSSLLNKLVGRPRAVVNSTPGTTRDAIDTPLWRDGRKYVFIDTAGIRRQSKVSQRLEKYMTIRALRSLERCDVALILLDGYEGLTEQDARIATFAQENGRALIFAVNKWDLVAKDTSTLQEYGQRIRAEIKTLDYVPILFISALTGQRVSRIFTAIEAVIREHRKRIATAELNRWLQETLRTNAPPPAGRRSVKVYYISQVDAAPPTFVLFTNDPARVTETYQRYLMRQLREKFGFAGTPLRILLRRRKKEDG